jgi:hypothetical protein
MAIVNLDKVQAKKYGNLESVKHSADLTNGLFFALGNLVAGETELREASVINESASATSASTSEEIVLHASSEVMYDPRKSGLKDFVLTAGDAGRAYHLTVGDIVTLTSDLFTSAPTVGQFAVIAIDGSMKLRPSTDGTALASDGLATINPRLVFEVIEQTTLGYDGTTAYALQVTKA